MICMPKRLLTGCLSTLYAHPSYMPGGSLTQVPCGEGNPCNANCGCPKLTHLCERQGKTYTFLCNPKAKKKNA